MVRFALLHPWNCSELLEFNLRVFIEDFIIPYLFAQSHFKNTQKWLWGDLSHDYVGLLEWLGRQVKLCDEDTILTYLGLISLKGKEFIKRVMKHKIKDNIRCYCKSNKKQNDCHPELKLAIARLNGALTRGII